MAVALCLIHFNGFQAHSERMLGLLDLYGFEVAETTATGDASSMFRPRHILGVTAFLRRQVFPTNGFEQFLINYCPLLSQESCASYSFQHAKSVVKKSSDANHGAKKGF